MSAERSLIARPNYFRTSMRQDMRLLSLPATMTMLVESAKARKVNVRKLGSAALRLYHLMYCYRCGA